MDRSSFPRNRIEPSATPPSRTGRRTILRASVVLPAPDAPDTPTASPGPTSKLTSSSTGSRVDPKRTVRPRTCNNGADIYHQRQKIKSGLLSPALRELHTTVNVLLVGLTVARPLMPERPERYPGDRCPDPDRVAWHGPW